MKIQKFVFSENSLVVHQGGQLDMGCLALFAKNYTLDPQRIGVFESLAPALLIKKNGTREFEV